MSPETAETSPAAFPVGRDRLLALALVLLYAGLQIALFATHEAWRDEAQAWLWAKQLSTPWEFFFVPGEGHPPLWFWLLRVLSSVLSFDQARLLTLATAILNAWLLARLLRADIILLAAMLGSNILLQYWGYQFRPYNLVFTALLCALLLDRQQRPVAAAWVLALSCGLHLFSGLLFAMWLLVLLQRRTPMVQMVGPALLAAAFGAMAVVSGLGNPAGGLKAGTELARRTFDILAWPIPPGASVAPAVAAVGLATLGYALRRDRFLQVTTLALTLAFTAFGALVYGASEWHVAFLPMLAVMALILVGSRAPRWALPILLIPQVITGAMMAWPQISAPALAESAVYASVVADAGPDLDTASSLFAYPDYALSATAARHELTYRSAKTGAVLGPVDWRMTGTVDPSFVTTPTPFWLVCLACRVPVQAALDAGLKVTPLAKGVDADHRIIGSYRIDAGI